jgi:hypothetical protein
MSARTGVGRFTIVLSVAILLVAAKAQAGVTSLLLTGDPGDYISGGQTQFYTDVDGAFGASRNYHNGVSLSFHTPSYSHWWYLDFSAPGGQYLTVGTYTDAVRFPFEATHAGLAVYGDGRGCNTLTASFEVKEVVYGPGSTIVSFRATFVQHCEGFAPAARGEIRYNATVPLQLTAPAALSVNEAQPVAFAVSATDTVGRHVTLSASGLPPGATFFDNGDNTGSFSWVPGFGQAGKYAMSFVADNAAGNVETVYSTITVIAVPPPNDDLTGAIVISDLPFTHTETTTLATTAYDDPFCAGWGHSVWYSFTPAADSHVEINTFGSDYDTTLSVYSGSRGSLTPIACNDNSGRSYQSRVRFNAVAGTTYWIMASSYYGTSGGQLVLNALQAPPPLTVALTLDGFGGVDLTTGGVSLIGSVVCSRPILVTVSGQVKQDHGRSALTGQFSLVTACDASTDWLASIVVPPTLFQGRAADLFVGGKATVTASAVAVDQDAGETARSDAAATIILRGGR